MSSGNHVFYDVGKVLAAGLSRHRPRASGVFGIFVGRGRRGGEGVGGRGCVVGSGFSESGVRVCVGIVLEGGLAELKGSGDEGQWRRLNCLHQTRLTCMISGMFRRARRRAFTSSTMAKVREGWGLRL